MAHRIARVKSLRERHATSVFTVRLAAPLRASVRCRYMGVLRYIGKRKISWSKTNDDTLLALTFY